ncbi:MAG TPA: hypothetical protein PLW65_04290 [Pseudomonadota bacterium]|nr:hypothetical protein [Pseudomonadota bacterium]
MALRILSGVVAVVLLVVLIGNPAPAYAEPAGGCEDGPVCRKLLAEGRQHFMLGRYEPARAAFKSAFEQSHDPEVLVHLGRTLQLLGKHPEALEVYRSYLLTAPYQAPARLQVVEWAREVLPAAAEASQDATPAPEPARSAATVVPRPCGAADGRRNRRLKIAGGIFLGGATLGLAASAVLAGLNGRDEGGLCEFRGVSSACVLDARAALISGFVLSGVGLAAGTAMLTVGLRGGPDKRGSLCDVP